MQSLSSDVAQYQDMKGMPAFRKALAAFLERKVFNARGWTVDPAHLCVSAGVGSLVNLLGLTLFEAGDSVLIPSPSYASFDFDLKVLKSGTCPLRAYWQNNNMSLRFLAVDVEYSVSQRYKLLRCRWPLLLTG